MKRKYKDIRISTENWEKLSKLGTAKDTFNSVITKILEQTEEGSEEQ